MFDKFKKIRKALVLFINFILVLELISWPYVLNNNAKAASPYFDIYVDYKTGAQGPAINFQAKNGFSGTVNVEFIDLNLPSDTTFVVSSLNDHINWLDVPDEMTLSNISEIKKLNIPLGEKEWNGFSPSMWPCGASVADYSFKIRATGSGYTGEKTVNIHCNGSSGEYSNIIIPIDDDFNKHTVNAGSSTTYRLGATSTYNGTMNVSSVLPSVTGLSSSLPSSVNVVQDMGFNTNVFDYTVSTTSSTANGYYFISIKSNGQGKAGSDRMYTYRLKVNNTSGQQNQSTNNQQSGNNTTDSTTVSSQPSASTDTADSSSASTASSTSSTTQSASQQSKSAAKKQENLVEKAAEVINNSNLGELSDTPGELAISPESGGVDSKIEIRGQGYPVNTDLRILWGPFMRYVVDKTTTEDKPPFRWQGLIDLGIIKTDGAGNFSTYRILPTDNPIIKSLTGVYSIRVGEDKVYNGQMGTLEHPYNEKITKRFTIPIPVGQSQQIEQQAISQVWTGKENLNELNQSEKIAVNNLSLGLKEEAYNQPFDEEKIATQQKVISYTLTGFLGKDGQPCKLKIKPEDYAYQISPLKKLAKNIFKSLRSAKAETVTNDINTQALEDCPNPLDLSQYFRSDIIKTYSLINYKNEAFREEYLAYSEDIAKVYDRMTNLFATDAGNYSNKLIGTVQSTIEYGLEKLEHTKNMTRGSSFFRSLQQNIDMVDFRDFLDLYLRNVTYILADSANEEQINFINNKIKNEDFYRSLRLPELDKEKTKTTLTLRGFGDLTPIFYASIGYGKPCTTSLDINAMITNCDYPLIVAAAKAINYAKLKSDMDYVFSQMPYLLQKYAFDNEESAKRLLLLAIYGALKQKILPADNSQEVQKQLNDIKDHKIYILSENESVVKMLEYRESLKRLANSITDRNALTEYLNLVNYTNIKYRYLIGKSDPNNPAGIDYQTANSELTIKVTSGDYPVFTDPNLESENEFLDEMYWQLSSEDNAEQIRLLKSQLENYQLKSPESQNKYNDLLKYSDLKLKYLTGNINGSTANEQIKELQFYMFTPFIVKSNEMVMNIYRSNWFDQIKNIFKISNSYASDFTNPRDLAAEAEKRFNQANAIYLNAVKNYHGKKDPKMLQEYIKELNRTHRELLKAKEYISYAIKASGDNPGSEYYYNLQQQYVAFDYTVVQLISNLPKPATQANQSTYSLKNYGYNIIPIADETALVSLKKEYNGFASLGDSGILLQQKDADNYNKIKEAIKIDDPGTIFWAYVLYKTGPKSVVIDGKVYSRDNINDFPKYYNKLTVKLRQSKPDTKNGYSKTIDDLANNSGSSKKYLVLEINKKTKEDKNGNPVKDKNGNPIWLNEIVGGDKLKNSSELKTFIDKQLSECAESKSKESKKSGKSSFFNINKAHANDGSNYYDDYYNKYPETTQAYCKNMESATFDITFSQLEEELKYLDQDSSGNSIPTILQASQDAVPWDYLYANYKDLVLKYRDDIGKLLEEYQKIVQDVYSGSIPKFLEGTLGEGKLSNTFMPYIDPNLRAQVKAAAASGKCGYQEFECGSSFNTINNVANKCSAVILCNNSPQGSGLDYGTSLNRQSSSTSRKNSNIAYAAEDGEDSNKDNNTTLNFTNFIHLYSDNPLGLMVIDPTGRAVGWNPLSQKEIQQIHNADYNGISAAKPEMLLRGLLEGEYSIRLIGLDDGPYKVNLALAMGDQVWTKTYQGMVKKNEIVDGKFQIGLEKQSLIPLTKKLFNKTTYTYGGIGLGVLVIAGAAYYYIHHKENLRFWFLKPVSSQISR